MTARRTRLEKVVQREIELALGAEPYMDPDGGVFHVPYGLGTGSPDLVGILAPWGRWLCLEVKAPGEDARDEQEKCHRAWRRFGAFVETVRSVEEARTALQRARDDSAARARRGRAA
jgi:hypothetical protein